MGIEAIFESENWQVSFRFWSAVFFVLGCLVGSFLNVCIHRLPLEMSVVSPPSHCPTCKYSIPWYLNVPLVTWLVLRGRCAHCRAPISVRYFWVELLTGILFLSCWLVAGEQSAALAAVYCLFVAGLVAATFIDFEHFIIPDEITKGGMVAGVTCSLAVPAVQGEIYRSAALWDSFLGMAVGGGVVYFILRLGKLLFGRKRIELEPDTPIVFTETALVFPEEEVPFEDLFYRKTDLIQLEGKQIELVDRCYAEAHIRLTPEALQIGEESLDPEQVHYLKVRADRIVLPQEAMGFGDVKFMAAIGAFLGMEAAIFSLLASSILGALVGGSLIVFGRREWSSRIPYGPYIALAAALWLFGGRRLTEWWLDRGMMGL